MSRIRRWLTQARRIPPMLAASAPGLGPWLARRRWPKTEGTLHLAGLHDRVEIVRDTWGVPHLYASDEHDLFFAQGFVHAQDRLWQMELNRRMGQGTMAAALGRGGVPLDRFVRTLDLPRMAERALDALDADARAILEAYASGVNARIEAGGPLPLEFSILGVSPEPWSPLASLAHGNVLALLLSGNHRIELLRASLVAEVGEAVASMLLPPHAPETPVVVRGLAGVTAMDGLDAVDGWLGDPNIVSGSNNWVIHGSRTASGKPLLANDLHIGLHVPSTWYENGLHGGRFDVTGFSLPGEPLVVLGRNRAIAWGMSNLGPDTQDFYVERLDPADHPTRYAFEGQWQELQRRHETIEVRGEEPRTIEILSTRHGPIMNAAMSGLLAGCEPLALRWSLGDSGPLLPALIGMNLATGWEAFRAALRRWETPGQNFVYADVDGNIGYQCTGRIPIRASGHTGIEPAPGWTGESEWQGFVPFDELPSAFNPPEGYVVTANNKVTADDYPYPIAYHWFPGYRARRIVQLIEETPRHTVADMRRIQTDTYSLPAEILRPHLLAVRFEDEDAARAQALVAGWDLRCEVDRCGATVFQAWYARLLRALLAHKLGPSLVERYLAGEYERHGSLHAPFVTGLLDDPGHAWFAAAGESRDEVVRRSFLEAVAWLRREYGPDPSGWTWGRAHTVSFVHLPLGRGPRLARRLFNTPTVGVPGDNYTVDGASFVWSRPFSVVHGTAMRMIVDLGDPDGSLAVHVPGQSEHLHHPHRADQLELARAREYHPLLFGRDRVDAHRRAVLALVPSPRSEGRPA